ncbi:proline reductase cluster protein PrdD [Lutispora saccharofermentans]|uniref:Proline reductase cluster protein PrdD n=1 Tax=Lutispora saccharofermentans TaxID=3024236 RepID=A0ABT1NDY0_9FIRM|nr:proline reductase cluster protein PrdD [Lutispora saccharofermentans]MCQ1529445.1 proline reductase cluster protein PrdD [Lutispora saccharofermentans]
MVDNDKIEMRRLVIKSYHITEVSFADKTEITGKSLSLRKNIIDDITRDEPLINDLSIEIIMPGEHDRWVNSIMDIMPISAKVLGRLGEGITHTLTGVYVMLTGVDKEGIQVAEFGSSEGNLQEQMILNRPGTPGDKDIIILVDVTLKAGEGHYRTGPTAAHRVCDKLVQEIREKLKKLNGKDCTERHEFYDVIKPGRKKVAIIKQVAGQGTMYDTQLFAKEPSGFAGGRSIIDLGNVPVIVSPNEYRDGAIRAMH